MFIMCFLTIPAAVFVIAAGLYSLDKYLKRNKQRDIYFKSLTKNLPVGLYLRDMKGNFLFANEEFSKMTGFSRRDLEKMNLKSVFSPKYLINLENEEKEILKTKSSLTIEKTMTFFKDEVHNYRIIKSPVIDEKANINAFIVLFKNIDKEKAMEDAKETFIATLTHDLKNPTIAQINMLNLLLDGNFGELNPEQHEMIRLTKCSCKYMSDLVATILDTYRCNNCDLKMNYEKFDIIDMIKALCKGTESLAKEKEQDLIFNHNVEECIVDGDRLQIKRVIVNLVSNALTYGFKRTPVKIDVIQCDGSLDFSVMNKSKQIPEHVLKNIFNKFTKTEMTHYNKASTSLGLYLSKCIIDMHDGEIYAKSFEDGTCVFGFKLALERKETKEQKTDETFV